MTGAASRAAAERAARLSYGKLVATLAAGTRDLVAAEDALADALVRALESWPRDGVPERPEAWLVAVARRAAIDHARRRATARASTDHLALIEEERATRGADGMPDDRLKLLFVCAHPAIDAHARAPLMLQTVLGLSAERMASAFLVDPRTLGQRLTRAKRKIKTAGLRFAEPAETERADRVGAVLDAVYVAYTLGWDNAFSGNGGIRDLAEEAIWLVRLVVDLLPGEPEARGLLALMLFCEARGPARRDPVSGAYVALADQDPGRWHEPMLAEAEIALRVAGRTGRLGRFQLEAAIQAVHADRRRSGRTNWSALATLYAGLTRVSPTVGAILGHAVALAATEGPAAGLARLDALPADRVGAHQPYWAARAHLLAETGEAAAAMDAYDRAIALVEEPAVRAHLIERKRALTRPDRDV